MKRTFFCLIGNLLISQLGIAQYSNEQLLVHDTMSIVSPYAICSADFDGDGNNDILTSSNYGDIVAWHKNLGAGHFGPAIVITTDIDFSTCVYAADVDGDGDPDAMANSKNDNLIAWFENTGGEFGPPQVVTDGAWNVIHFKTEDLDGDGDQDAYAACYGSGYGGGGYIAWYENSGSGSFGPEQQISDLVDGARSVDSRDFDWDGDNDILCLSRNSGDTERRLAWFENNGSGSFGPLQLLSSNSALEIGSTIASDVDGDGDFDAITTNYGLHLTWFENNGSGSFGPPVFISDASTEYDWVQSDDLDADGDQDLVASSAANSKLVCFLNSGGGVFAPPIVLLTVAYPAQLALQDMDDDGDNDVLYCATVDEIGWIENQGGGLFEGHHLAVLSAGMASDVLSFDLDEDGDMDIVCASPTTDRIIWFENTGNGVFAGAHFIAYDQASAYLKMTLADFNSDGKPDILTGSDASSQLTWYKNMVGGVMTGASIYAPGVAYPLATPMPADINGDGLLDVVYVHDARVKWIPNNGSTWGSQIILGPNHFKSSFPYDMDGDGDIDILCATELFDQLRWYENLGSGTFGAYQTITSMTNPINAIMADLNGDGIADMIANTSSQIRYFKGLGGLTFAAPITIGSQNSITKVLASDADADNDIDIVASSLNDDKITWYENLGDAAFGPQQVISNIADGATSVALADIDGDGDKDVVSSSQNDGKIAWYQNYVYSTTQVHGRVFIDLNQNEELDSTDIGLNQVGIISSPASDYTFSYTDGKYFMNFSDTGGIYQIQPEALAHWAIVTDSLSYHVQIDSTFSTMDSLDFGLFPDTIFHQVDLELTGAFPRCNSLINYWINYKNSGTTIPSGSIHLQLDDSISYVNATVTPDSIIGQDIYWAYDSLFYFSDNVFNVHVLMPDFNSMGDTLSSFLAVNIIDSLGNEVYSNVDTLDQIVVCAYDPNDKISTPAGVDSLGYIPPATPDLEYTIRFQNTGNDTAINVVIKDHMDPHLDWQSLNPLASSHPVQIYVDQNGEATFTFNQIMLPDSNVNELASHGFVKYRINLLPEIPIGTSIYNTAGIYFDENPAVVTNTAINTIYDCISVIESAVVPSQICENEVLIGEAVIDPPGVQFNWDLMGVQTSSGKNFIFPADTTGIFDLVLTADASFCSADTTFNITIYPAVPTQFLSPVEICYGDSTQIFGQYESTEGIYYSTYQNINGCDSVFAQQLLVLPQIITDLGYFEICSGHSLLIFGVPQSTPGLYYDTLSAINGCDSLLMKQLHVLPPPSTDFGHFEICSGDSLLIFGSFQSAPGIYYDTIPSTTGCDSVLFVQLDELALPVVAFSSLADDHLCTQSNLIIMSATPPGGIYTGTAVSGNQFDPSAAGPGTHSLAYHYSDSNGCSATDSVHVQVSDCLGTNEEPGSTITVFPNPMNDYTTINFGEKSKDGYHVYIYDAVGRKVYSTTNFTGNQLLIHRNTMPTGVYMLSVVSSTAVSQIYTVKLVVE